MKPVVAYITFNHKLSFIVRLSTGTVQRLLGRHYTADDSIWRSNQSSEGACWYFRLEIVVCFYRPWLRRRSIRYRILLVLLAFCCCHHRRSLLILFNKIRFSRSWSSIVQSLAILNIERAWEEFAHHPHLDRIYYSTNRQEYYMECKRWRDEGIGFNLALLVLYIHSESNEFTAAEVTGVFKVSVLGTAHLSKRR